MTNENNFGVNFTGIKLIFFNYVNYYKLHGAIMVVIVCPGLKIIATFDCIKPRT
jgi:hypothetical protein